MTFDVDLFELVAERLEQLACFGSLERRRREPFAKVARPRRAVGAQVAPADFGERLFFPHLLPAFNPLVRPDEGDLGPARRSLTELGEEESETRAQPLLVLSANTAHDLRRSEEHTSELQSHVNLVCRL